jgi:hypothetical protein
MWRRMMQSSEILREAADVIRSGREESVCWAIAWVVGERSLMYLRQSETKAGRIICRISKSLGETNLFVDEGLIDQGVPSRKLTDEAMKDYRIRWCLWMAEGYEKIGD